MRESLLKERESVTTSIQERNQIIKVAEHTIEVQSSLRKSDQNKLKLIDKLLDDSVDGEKPVSELLDEVKGGK